MKKIVIIPLLLALIIVSSCQSGLYTTALNQKDEGNYAEALETINAAIDPANEESETSINNPRTWQARGEIYRAIYTSDDEAVKQLAENPLQEAYRSYQKALSLDEEGDLTNALKLNLTMLTNDFTDQAVKAFEEEDYETALHAFENILEIENMDIIKADSPESIDTVIIYNAGLAAYNSNNVEEAIKYFRQSADYDYGEVTTYRLLAESHKQNQDTTAALEVLKEGFEKYPDDNSMLNSMIQVFLDTDQTEEAMTYLNVAIEQDPTNATYYFALGTLHERQENEEEAIEAYEKAIELNDEYFDAYYNIGALYYNRGVEQLQVANDIPASENERYQEAVELANEEFRKALPYMERCLELNPEDPTTLSITLETLKNLYYRLQMTDKYNEVLEILGE